MGVKRPKPRKNKKKRTRGSDRMSSLTMQDLINVLAAQEHAKNKVRPCGGTNGNVCVAEGCFNGEDCIPDFKPDELPLAKHDEDEESTDGR